MQKDELKPVPNHPFLYINSNGTQVIYNGKNINILNTTNNKNNTQKRVYIGRKTYLVSRLVFAAWVKPLPYYRRVRFKDNNPLNLELTNLLPELYTGDYSELLKVPNFKGLYISSDGKTVVQDGFYISVQTLNNGSIVATVREPFKSKVRTIKYLLNSIHYHNKQIERVKKNE